jgi:hypothetical protein
VFLLGFLELELRSLKTCYSPRWPDGRFDDLPRWCHCEEAPKACTWIETHHARVMNGYSLVERSLTKSL